MYIYDKDNNFLAKLFQINNYIQIRSILDINDELYIVESIILNNDTGQDIAYVDTYLNHKLRNHVLQFTYDYYTPEEIQYHLDSIGLEIRLKDDIDYSKDKRVIKVTNGINKK